MHIYNLIKGACRPLLQQVMAGTQAQVMKSPNMVKALQLRSYANCPTGMKVAICGAGGNTGQPLALMLKQSPLLDEIALYDVCAVCGFGMELAHIDTKCKVSAYCGRQNLAGALDAANVVVIVARNGCDTFENNAPILTDMTLQICNSCPSAFVIVATEPIESMVPLIAEIQRLRNNYNARKLLGVVELNCSRANMIVSQFLNVEPEKLKIPVIGGTTAQTMVPVLSSAMKPYNLSQEQVECITSCIMLGQDDYCKYCNNYCCRCACGENPFFAGAAAIARTTLNVVKGLQGTTVTQCAYVDNLGTCCPDCQFFSSEVVFGPSGIEKNLGVPELSKFENCLLWNCLPGVQNEIARAVWLVYVLCSQCCCAACHLPPPMPWLPPAKSCYDCSDYCRDEYLATVCRDMVCRCGNFPPCWKPRPADYDAKRAANLTHQMAVKTATCCCQLPRSVRIAQEIKSLKDTKDVLSELDKKKDP